MENAVIKNACYIIDEDRYYRLIGALATAAYREVGRFDGLPLLRHPIDVGDQVDHV